MIKNHKDFWSGLLFVALGLSVISIARDYPFGSSTRMGSGYFPMLLACLLAALGLLITVRSLLSRKKVSIDALALKPLFFVLAATVLYGVLVREAGLIATTFACVLLSARASIHGRWLPQVVLAVCTTACCVLIFIKGLGIPLSAFGRFFE
jgi:hypothetical protein